MQRVECRRPSDEVSNDFRMSAFPYCEIARIGKAGR